MTSAEIKILVSGVTLVLLTITAIISYRRSYCTGDMWDVISSFFAPLTFCAAIAFGIFNLAHHEIEASYLHKLHTQIIDNTRAMEYAPEEAKPAYVKKIEALQMVYDKEVTRANSKDWDAYMEAYSSDEEGGTK